MVHSSRGKPAHPYLKRRPCHDVVSSTRCSTMSWFGGQLPPTSLARTTKLAGQPEHCTAPAFEHESCETSPQILVNTNRSELLFFVCPCLGTLFGSIKKPFSVRPSSKFDSNGVGASL